MADETQGYDWAQALVDLAESGSADFNELAAAAGLIPSLGDLSDIDFTALDLSGQDLRGWDLSNAKWNNAKLNNTNLTDAKIDAKALLLAEDWRQAKLGKEDAERIWKWRMMLKRIDELELSVRTYNCLSGDNIVFIGDLIQKSEPELLRVPNFGRKSLMEVTEVLSSMGLHLGSVLDGWPPPIEYFERAETDDAF